MGGACAWRRVRSVSLSLCSHLPHDDNALSSLLIRGLSNHDLTIHDLSREAVIRSLATHSNVLDRFSSWEERRWFSAICCAERMVASYWPLKVIRIMCSNGVIKCPSNRAIHLTACLRLHPATGVGLPCNQKQQSLLTRVTRRIVVPLTSTPPNLLYCTKWHQSITITLRPI